jgi:hypothetical protein
MIGLRGTRTRKRADSLRCGQTGFSVARREKAPGRNWPEMRPSNPIRFNPGEMKTGTYEVSVEVPGILVQDTAQSHR